MHILNVGLYTLKMLNQAVITVEQRNNLEITGSQVFGIFNQKTAMELKILTSIQGYEETDVNSR